MFVFSPKPCFCVVMTSSSEFTMISMKGTKIYGLNILKNQWNYGKVLKMLIYPCITSYFIPFIGLKIPASLAFFTQSFICAVLVAAETFGFIKHCITVVFY